MSMEDEIQASCRNGVLLIFPDICPNYLERVAAERNYDAEQVTTFVVDEVEQNRPYPRRPQTSVKRKREESNEPEPDLAGKFGNPVRDDEWDNGSYAELSMTLLQQAFRYSYTADLKAIFREKGQLLFPAYLEIHDRLDEEAGGRGLPSGRKTYPMKERPEFREDLLLAQINVTVDPTQKAALEEYSAAIQVCKARKAAKEHEKQLAQAEIDNLAQAKAEGAVAECGCCFDEFALNRMVHCDGTRFHYFCRDCSRQMAEHQIGLSKYELTCMSTDGCESQFAADQQALFVDGNAAIALGRLEQEAMLRLAGIENLETCPFCPFAMEYPPVEENKEFQCENPECCVRSCRLCRKETHIPISCEEASQDHGSSARRLIEEAMSAALIRKCNKCQTPFIKENGCNKMTCSKPHCRNVQCYVCHKSCDYAHFNDTNRGGKQGNCPLFDDGAVDKRHDAEVRAAEEEARKRVVEDNPTVDAKVLEVTAKMSQSVQQSNRTAQAAGRGAPGAIRPQPMQHQVAAAQAARLELARRQNQQRQLLEVARQARNAQKQRLNELAEPHGRRDAAVDAHVRQEQARLLGVEARRAEIREAAALQQHAMIEAAIRRGIRQVNAAQLAAAGRPENPHNDHNHNHANMILNDNNEIVPNGHPGAPKRPRLGGPFGVGIISPYQLGQRRMALQADGPPPPPLGVARHDDYLQAYDPHPFFAEPIFPRFRMVGGDASEAAATIDPARLVANAAGRAAPVVGVPNDRSVRTPGRTPEASRVLTALGHGARPPAGIPRPDFFPAPAAWAPARPNVRQAAAARQPAVLAQLPDAMILGSVKAAPRNAQ